MSRILKFARYAVVLLVIFAAAAAVGAKDAAALTSNDECEAWYVGTNNDSEWWYFECQDENGDTYHGWMIIPV